MIPTVPADYSQPVHADASQPRFFLDAAYDANLDSDWWLDLGGVDLPLAPAV
jgi:hypothetical protein